MEPIQYIDEWAKDKLGAKHGLDGHCFSKAMKHEAFRLGYNRGYQGQPNNAPKNSLEWAAWFIGRDEKKLQAWWDDILPKYA